MVNQIIHSLESVVFGKKDAIELLVMALIADGHVLIEDVPGTGKTTLAKALAKVVGARFTRVQFTPDLLPADVTGGAIFRVNTGEFEIKKGPIFTQILLADEINRASPRTQSSLLEAMEERQVSIEGVSYSLPQPFMVLATENPVEFHGVFPLPEAQMDRFLIKISLGYPSEETELLILKNHRMGKPLDKLEPITNLEEILKIRKTVSEIFIDENLERYIVSLVNGTRKHSKIRLAASPRAGINLVKMAQASAFIKGRDFVNPDDIQHVFIPVMEHRIFSRDNHFSSKNILETILAEIKIPK